MKLDWTYERLKDVYSRLEKCKCLTKLEKDYIIEFIRREEKQQTTLAIFTELEKNLLIGMHLQKGIGNKRFQQEWRELKKKFGVAELKKEDKK